MNKIFNYFIENIQLFYDVKDISIGYGLHLDEKILISKNVEDDFWNNKNDIDINSITWKEWRNKRIPFLFRKESNEDVISYENGKAIINYDIVASAFYFLSGWNENINSSKDDFGRVKYEDSIIKKLNIISIPVVNYYFDILSECIQKVHNKDVKKKLWNNSTFTTLLTHDIDTCKSCWLEGSFSELKKKRILSVPKLVFKRFFGSDDWFNFDKIVEIEKKYNVSSSFYFLAQKGKVGKWKNADYNILDKDVQRVIRKLKDNNCEIGVHGSFGTHLSKESLMVDIKRINSESIIGNRFHFLMFNPGKSVKVLEDCNIKYDTSLGFAEHIGFRRGTCYPFYLWDFEENKMSSVLEIPLNVMDRSLSSKKYMGLSQEEALQKIFELSDEVKIFNGVFTLLWHNIFFSDYKYTGWKNIYCEILEYSIKNNALLSRGENIYNRIIHK